MQYYILHTCNRELVRLSMVQYLNAILNKEEDDILIVYNPVTGEVKSKDSDISEYWFHDFNGMLEEIAHSSPDEARFFLEIASDFGKDSSALSAYNHTINNQTRYSLVEY